jgi:hypothetical protein
MEERLRQAWRSGWCLAVLVVLGLGLRSYHYLRQPPVWHDEAALLINILDRDYGQLLGPLRFHEAAPPLFLWLERATGQVFGDGLFSLRLPSFLASCLALLLLVPIARRLLTPEAVPWALLLFACSEQLSWHACEAKPYAFDILVAVLILGLFLIAETRPGTALGLAALLCPVFLWLSYPACFLEGGLLAALLPAVWRRRAIGPWLAYLITCGLIGAAFLALVSGPVAHQHDVTIVDCWTRKFPDWHQPWTIPVWVVASTLDVVRYCCKPLGQPLVILAVTGAVLFWRRGQKATTVLLTLPIGLALLAAFLHRYPYGGARVMVHDAPALLLLIGAAVPSAFALLRPRSRLAACALVLFLLIPVGNAAWRIVFPWLVADTAAASDFVQSRQREGDVITGNDWTHLYYFRHDRAFAYGDEPTPTDAQRLWVVYTAEVPADKRLAWARAMAPAGWHLIQERSEFTFTTVALFEP